MKRFSSEMFILELSKVRLRCPVSCQRLCFGSLSLFWAVPVSVAGIILDFQNYFRNYWWYQSTLEENTTIILLYILLPASVSFMLSYTTLSKYPIFVQSLLDSRWILYIPHHIFETSSFISTKAIFFCIWIRTKDFFTHHSFHLCRFYFNTWTAILIYGGLI